MLRPDEPLAVPKSPTAAELIDALRGALETYVEANDNQGLHAEKLVPVIEANLRHNGWRNIPADMMVHALWSTGVFSDVSVAAKPRPARPGQVTPDFCCTIEGVQDSPVFYLTANEVLLAEQGRRFDAVTDEQLKARAETRRRIELGLTPPPKGPVRWRVPPPDSKPENTAFDPHATHRVGMPAPRTPSH